MKYEEVNNLNTPPPIGITYFVSVLAVHDIGEGDLCLEHLPAVHQLHQ